MDELRGSTLQIVLHIKEGCYTCNHIYLENSNKLQLIVIYRARIWISKKSFSDKRFIKWIRIRY